MPEPVLRRIVVCSGVLAAAVAGVLPYGPFYLTNDDVAMRLLAEGRMAPGYGPTPFLMFMHAAVGALLAGLYGMASVVPWYDLLMAVTTVAGSIALVSVWTAADVRRQWPAALAYSLALLAPLFATPQFSLAGMTAAAAGLCLVARSLLEGELAHRTRIVWIGALLFVWGALVRWEAAALLLAQAVASVTLLRSVGRTGASAGSARPIVRSSALAVAILVVVAASQILVYRAAPGWRDFPEFNMRRARFGEWAAAQGLSSETASALRNTVGWSANDLFLLRSWFFADPNVFNLHALRKAADVVAQVETRASWDAAVAASRGAGRMWAASWPAIAVVFFVAAWGQRARTRLIRLTLLLSVMSAGLFIVTVTLKDVPFRVYWPMLILAVGLTGAPAEPRRHVLHRHVLAAVTTVLVAGMMFVRWGEQRARRDTYLAVAEDVAALNALSPRVAVVHAAALRWEYAWRPFRPTKVRVPVVPIGASAQTPPVRSALASHGLDPLLPAVCRDPDVVLVADPWIVPSLVTYMDEHYDQTVTFTPLLSGETLTAWRCR